MLCGLGFLAFVQTAIAGIVLAEVRTSATFPTKDVLFAFSPLGFVAALVALSAFAGWMGEADEAYLRAWAQEILQAHPTA